MEYRTFDPYPLAVALDFYVAGLTVLTGVQGWLPCQRWGWNVSISTRPVLAEKRVNCKKECQGDHPDRSNENMIDLLNDNIIIEIVQNIHAAMTLSISKPAHIQMFLSITKHKTLYEQKLVDHEIDV